MTEAHPGHAWAPASPTSRTPGFRTGTHLNPGNFSSTTTAGSGRVSICTYLLCYLNRGDPVVNQPYKGAQSLSCCPACPSPLCLCGRLLAEPTRPPNLVTYGTATSTHPPLFQLAYLTLAAQSPTQSRYLYLPSRTSNLTHEKRDNTTRNVTTTFCTLVFDFVPYTPPPR